MTDDRRPRLWPPGASADYRSARVTLLEAESALRADVEDVAALRRSLPHGAVLNDYVLLEGPADLAVDEPLLPVPLRAAFGRHRTLVVYHLMYAPDANEACPMCSMWVDGLHGVSHHLAQHTALAVVAKARPAKLRGWGRRRGWRGLRLLSSHGSGFNADLGVEAPDGRQFPGVSVLRAEGDHVCHIYTAQPSMGPGDHERGIDLLSPVWQVLDLLPQGRGDWYAGNDYPTAARSEPSASAAAACDQPAVPVRAAQD